MNDSQAEELMQVLYRIASALEESNVLDRERAARAIARDRFEQERIAHVEAHTDRLLQLAEENHATHL